MSPFTLALPWRDPVSALAPFADEAGIALLHGGGEHPQARWSYIVASPLRQMRWTEGDRGGPFDELRHGLRAFSGLAPPDGLPFAGGWVGCLSYELGRAFEALPWPGGDRDGWPDLALGLHDTVAAFDNVNRVCTVVSWGLNDALTPDENLARDRAAAFADRLGTGTASVCGFNPATIEPKRNRADVEAAAARAVAYVHAGDVFQSNISQVFTGYLGASDTPWALFQRLASANPTPFSAYLRVSDRAIVSQSPERFISVTADGSVLTSPIKGTRPRGKTVEADNAFAADLLSSLKDRAENVMIVDLMRNDLARVCRPGSVSVSRLFGLESFSTLHHLVSDVEGELRDGLSALDLLEASFPPGSVTGAPKVRAMEIIAELEGAARGPYCGAIIALGFDGALQSSVAIRTAACVEDTLGWRISFRVGGGIVADSKPGDEADETLVKARALLGALLGSAGSFPP